MDAAQILQGNDFGALGGMDIAQRTETRKLEAQKTMGEIAAIPSLQRQREAHARLYEAGAAKAEEEVDQSKRMAKIMSEIAGGEKKDAPSTPADLAGYMTQLSEVAFRDGLVKQGADLANKAVSVMQKIAQTEAAEGSAAVRNERAEQMVLDKIGGLALSATDQASYERARMAALSDETLARLMKKRGFDPSKLPLDFEQAKPFLAQLGTQVQKASDLLKAEAKKKVDAAEIAKDRAQAAAAGEGAAASRARVKILDAQYQDIVKNGGDTTGGARALRDERRKAVKDAEANKEAKREADAKLKRTQLSLRATPMDEGLIKDPAKRVPGTLYRTPRGPLTWTGQGWTDPLAKEPAAANTSTEDDDGEDDE